MRGTFKALASFMEKERVNDFVPGRKGKHVVADVLGKGFAIIIGKRTPEANKEPATVEDDPELQDDRGIDL